MHILAQLHVGIQRVDVLIDLCKLRIATTPTKKLFHRFEKHLVNDSYDNLRCISMCQYSDSISYIYSMDMDYSFYSATAHRKSS